MNRGLIAGVALLLLLAGCGGSSKPKPVDTPAMISAMGLPPNYNDSDAAKLVKAIRAYCDDDRDQMRIDVATALDGGGMSDVARTTKGIHYVCPDSEKRWTDAIEYVQSLG